MALPYPLNDEPLVVSPAELFDDPSEALREMDEAEASIERGEGIPHTEVRRRLGLGARRPDTLGLDTAR